jgi:uncharacterized protein (UPF0335 family)
MREDVVAKSQIAETVPGSNALSPKKLSEFCERIESLMEDRKVINEDIKVVLEEAEHLGYDKKTIKKVVKFRGMDKVERDEERALTDMYLEALGLL